MKDACEILVVDSFSTDNTLEVCREYGARILQHEYTGPAKQKNWAVGQCSQKWVLQMDADEVLGPGLWSEIQAAVRTAPDDLHAFRIPRKNHYLGEWVRHGGFYPDYQIRLFRTDFGRWRDREVHEHIHVPGIIGTLTCPIVHEGMPTLSKQLANLDRYTLYEAHERRKNNRRFRLGDLVLRSPLVFIHRYVWLQGFRDGIRGLILSGYTAFYVFLSYAKLWEMEARNPKS